MPIARWSPTEWPLTWTRPIPTPAEYFHTNTQLFNILDEHNRFKIGEGVSAPWNTPPPGATPTMDGFVTDYISTFTAEVGRQPTYDEYAQIMTGYTPEQLPVLSGIARDVGVFDHWFSEVPSQTFMNRSFWTAATSSGLVVNSPATKWMEKNTAETIFERLEFHGKTWKVYVCEPMPLSFTGVVHFPRLQHRLATHFVPFGEFEKDAAAGTLPDFSLIEPDMASGHNDYHPALSRSMIGIKRHLEEESETTCEALNGILHFTHGPTHHWFAYECTAEDGCERKEPISSGRRYRYLRAVHRT